MPTVMTTWVNRKDNAHSPELVCAWDEYSIDENSQGWQKDRQRALDAVGRDLMNVVDIEIYVPYEVIDKALNPRTLKAPTEVTKVIPDA